MKTQMLFWSLILLTVNALAFAEDALDPIGQIPHMQECQFAPLRGLVLVSRLDSKHFGLSMHGRPAVLKMKKNTANIRTIQEHGPGGMNIVGGEIYMCVKPKGSTPVTMSSGFQAMAPVFEECSGCKNPSTGAVMD